MTRQKGLGRGLEDILSEGFDGFAQGKEIINIPLDRIDAGEYQVREKFEDEALTSLADSIAEQGVLEPILVYTKPDGRFGIVAGERRCRASKLAQKEDIPAIVLTVDDPKILTLIGLIENVQRENLNALEEAQAYRNLKVRYEMTQEEIATATGKSRPVVANSLRLLTLPPKIQEFLVRGELSAGHARILLSIDDPVRQMRLAILVVRRSLSVERLSIIAQSTDKARKKGAAGSLSPALAELEEELKETLATRVEIQRGAKKGKLVIEFYSDDELFKLARLLSNGE